MVLEWREKEHETMGLYELQSATTVDALWKSGLLKFFCASPMRANLCLLEFFINHWDHDLGAFDLQGGIFEITSEDIYFITGLSRRETPVNLEGTDRVGDLRSVQDYINTYCMPGTQKRGTCIPFSHVSDFPLQVLVSTIVRFTGSSSLHLVTRNQMRIVVECLQGAIFD